MGLGETLFPLLELVRRNKQQRQLGAWVFHGAEISSRKQVSQRNGRKLPACCGGLQAFEHRLTISKKSFSEAW